MTLHLPPLPSAPHKPGASCSGVSRLTAIGLLALALSGCIAADAPGVRETQRMVEGEARTAMSVAARAASGADIQAGGHWVQCLQGVWKYDGDGTFAVAMGDDAEHRLAAIRSALLQAGYTDVTQVDGHVTVQRDAFTFDIRPWLAQQGPPRMRFSFRSGCTRYRTGDKVLLREQWQPLEGLGP